MNLTENEARKRECPYKFARDPDKWATYCVAVNCMAWRWSILPSGNIYLKQDGTQAECLDCRGAGTIPNDTDTERVTCPECDGEGKVGRHDEAGYCGLAGKPCR